MGLFYSDAGAEARKKAGAPSRKVIAVHQQKLLTCRQCPLDRERLVSPKMAPTGPVDAPIYFLGEAPGKNEDEEGTQFVGASGQFLRSFIPEGYEHLIRWNNTLRCRPPGNREPAPIETACCRRLQEEDIQLVKPRIIVGFGNVPLHWFLGAEDRTISNWRGRRIPVKVGDHVCWFFPITHPAALLYERDRKGSKMYEPMEDCFRRDLERVWQFHDEGYVEPHVETDYHAGLHNLSEYGQTGLAMVEDVLLGIRHGDHGLDLETSTLRPYAKHSVIATVAVSDYSTTFSFAWHHPEARWTIKEKGIIRDLLHEYVLGDGVKWAHGLRFEQEWLAHEFGEGVLYKAKWGDTLGQAHVLDERKGKSLDALTQLLMGFRIKALSNVDTSRIMQEPLSKVLPYNGMDAKYCYALANIQTEELAAIGKQGVYEFMNGHTPSLVQMQLKGAVRNLPAIEKLNHALKVEEAEAQKIIFEDPDVQEFVRLGNKFEPGNPHTLVPFFKTFLRIPNPTPNPQEPNKYSVDEEALTHMDHPVADLILKSRSPAKARSTYVVPLLDKGKDPADNCGAAVHDDGMVHTSISQYITASGRTSSSDPNLQNFPRRERKNIREVIGIPPDHIYVAFDYGQLEWRIGAELSQDAEMSRELVENPTADIHGEWTDGIGVKFVPKMVKESRKKVRDSIKQYWTFANLYGQTLGGLAWDLSQEFKIDISEDDLDPFFVAFWDKYPGLQEYQAHLIETYKSEGYVENGFGQRRHEPMKRNEIINHPFQGTAGQMVCERQGAICRYAYEQDKPWLVPWINIHDDLSFYFPKAKADEGIELVAHFMSKAPSVTRVPLTVECSVGTENWAYKEEIATFTTGLDGRFYEIVK